MGTTQKLIEILASLSSSEQQQFRSRLTEHQQFNQVSDYFDVLLGHIEYDDYGHPSCSLSEDDVVTQYLRIGASRKNEKEGMKYLQNASIRKGAHVVRNKLLQKALEFLENLETPDTKEALIRKYYRQAQALETRGINHQAEELYLKAYKLAIDYEYYALGLEIGRKYIILVCLVQTPQSEEKAFERLQTQEELMRDYFEELRCFKIQYKTYLKFRTHKGFSQDGIASDLEQLYHSKELQSPDKNKSFKSKIYAHQARALMADLAGEDQKPKDWYLRLVNILNQEPLNHLKEENGILFLRVVTNYLTYCLFGDDKSQFYKQLELLSKPKRSFSEAEWFQDKTYLDQLYYINSFDFEGAAALIPAIQEGLKTHQFKLNASKQITIAYNILLTYFALGKYDVFIQEYPQLTKMRRGSQERLDLQQATNLLLVISYYESDLEESYNFLKNFIRRNKPNFDVSAAILDFQRITIKYLIQLAELVTRTNQRDSDPYNAERSVLEAFRSDLKNFLEQKPKQTPPGLKEIIYWLNAKIDGSPPFKC